MMGTYKLYNGVRPLVVFNRSGVTNQQDCWHSISEREFQVLPRCTLMPKLL